MARMNKNAHAELFRPLGLSLVKSRTISLFRIAKRTGYHVYQPKQADDHSPITTAAHPVHHSLATPMNARHHALKRDFQPAIPEALFFPGFEKPVLKKGPDA
jgi:hypothetical protein